MSNEYQPWLELNLTELEYFKMRYLEMSMAYTNTKAQLQTCTLDGQRMANTIDEQEREIEKLEGKVHTLQNEVAVQHPYYMDKVAECKKLEERNAEFLDALELIKDLSVCPNGGCERKQICVRCIADSELENNRETVCICPACGTDFNLDNMVSLGTSICEERNAMKIAIEKHRTASGHNLCWENDEELWAVLKDGVTVDHTPPPMEEFMSRCKLYRESREKKDG